MNRPRKRNAIWNAMGDVMAADRKRKELETQVATTRDAMREAAVALADYVAYPACTNTGTLNMLRSDYTESRTAHRAALKALEDEKNGN